MTKIHHILGGTMLPRPGLPGVCHCLLLEDPAGLALVDAGLSLEETRRPVELIGQRLIDLVGLRFNEEHTALRQLAKLGFASDRVGHVVLTHAHLDHAGGLADFPWAQAHLAREEFEAIERFPKRYLPRQFEHGPSWRLHEGSERTWFGLEARPVQLGFASEVLLVPLFGHSPGHCGVAVQQDSRWLFHVGDALYARVELETDGSRASQLARAAAMNDRLRLESLEQLRRLDREHGDEIEIVSYHDPEAFPGGPQVI